MPKLSTYSAVWILTLLLSDFVVTENTKYPKRNISYLEVQEEISVHDCPKSFFRTRLLEKDDLFEIAGSLNKTLRVESDQATKDTHAGREHKRLMEKSAVGRTLMDYSGPAITEDLDDRNDKDFMNHIRVKRNEPPNDSILQHSMDLDESFPKFWNKSDGIYAFGYESAAKFEGSNANYAYRRNKPGVVDEIIETHSRRKRGVLSTNGQRRKRVKGITGHARRRVGAKKQRGKERGTSKKSSRKSATKKTHSSGKRSKKAAIDQMPSKTIVDESQIESKVEKRESSENSDVNTDVVSPAESYEKTGVSADRREYVSLINNASSDEQRDGNSVVLPLVHTGRAELRVRIEKIPANESLFVDPPKSWTDRSSTISSSHPTAFSGYGLIKEIADINVADSEVIANLDSVVTKKASNSTMKMIIPKKLDRASDVFERKSSDAGNTLSGTKNDRNSEDGRCERDASADEDAKSRAKRNQEIASKRHLRSDRNATISKRFGNAVRRTSNGGAKREETRVLPWNGRRIRGNRAARSIEQIKELAEKLIVKVNELQIYVSNRSETLRTRDSCIGKDASRAGIVGGSKFLPENSNSRSKIDDSHQFSAKSSERTTSTGKKRTSQTPASVSRFARGEYQGRRKSRRKWGRWTDWSSCSVTCGKGRQIRWRHCLRDCDDAETEMEEKACQLPACPPGKFLGIF